MPGIVQLSKKELDKLIESVEAEGGDSTEFKKLRAEVTETQPQKPARRQLISVVPREEPTTEERLEAEVGWLFPGGIITREILAKCVEMDGKYTLKELRDMCREAGVGLSGAKKELAAKLIAHE